jgi:actin-related protein 9
MPAFLALLNHVHNILSPTLHTPILLIAQPAWTAQDLETLTQFFFEKFKTPAFCIMDSALAVSYAYGVANATVIDVGYQKVDVTAVSDFAVQHVGRTMALTESGGDAMTRRLYELLGPKGWTMDMCEQLKRSPFCEILPHGTPLPGGDGEKSAPVANPAAASAANAPTAGVGAGPTVKVTEAPAAGGDAHIDEEDLDIADKAVDDEGVLDVASIVASGKTQEFLAAQEKKKAAAASRKAAKDARDAADAAAARPLRLPNSKREKVVFHYTERREVVEEPEAEKNPAHEETLQPKDEQTKEKTPEPAAAPTEIAVPAEPVEHGSAPEDAPATTSEPAATTAPTTNGDTAATIDPVAASAPTAVQDTKSTSLLAMDLSQAPDDSVTAAKKEQAKAAKREERRKAREHEGQAGIARKEIEVGTERFLVTSGGVLDAIADAVHRTVLAVDIGKRGDLWDSLVIVGNGSKVRGKHNLFPPHIVKYT